VALSSQPSFRRTKRRSSFLTTRLRNRWRKRVKYEILVERSNGLTIDRAVAKLRARYRRVARDNQFDNDEDLYELFLHTFTRSFGPHNWYLGEQTLEGFRS